MTEIKNGGFTLVEVIIFIAISAMLIITAMSSIGTRTRTAQFTDGMREIENYFQRQYSEVVNGSIDTAKKCRWNGSAAYNFPNYFTSQPSDGSCIFVGKVLSFADPGATTPGSDDRAKISSVNVVGERLSQEELLACQKNGDFLLYCADPDKYTTTGNFSIPWGVEMIGGYNFDQANSASRGTYSFGFFRSPGSSDVFPIIFIEGSDTTNGLALTRNLFSKNKIASVMNGGTRLSAIDEETNAVYCFKDASSTQYASISISSDNQGAGVFLGFRPAADYNNACDSLIP